MNEVLDFIRVFQSSATILLYSETACYWFAVILHNRFEQSTIYYNPDRVHFATMIDGVLYDISGMIDEEEKDEYYDYEVYQDSISAEELDIIKNNCILLKGGD